MTATVHRVRVIHKPEEQEQILAEGIRLERAGKFTGFVNAFLKAQEVLPESRRRSNSISSTNAIQWFVDAIKAFRNSPEAAQRVDHKPVDATTMATPESSAPASLGETRPERVRWKVGEQQALCIEAARLITDMKAGGPREALLLAQMNVLAPHRHRKIHSMTDVSSWYPEGLRAAMTKQRSEPKLAAAVAELAKINEDIAAQTHQPTTPTGQSFASEAASEPPTPAPASVPEPVAPTPAPELEPQHPAPAPAAAVPANCLIQSPGEDIASHLFGLWKGIRERLVQEVSNVFVEGIHRGMQRITLTQPPTVETCESSAPEPVYSTARDAAPTKTKPGQSVLVVGLKGNQPEHIKADFAGKLDLRFCSADQSKDQLRSMASAADVTVAVTDFISHSHEDIIKARAPRFIRCAGGMTHLKQELARLSGAHHANGRAHA